MKNIKSIFQVILIIMVIASTTISIYTVSALNSTDITYNNENVYTVSEALDVLYDSVEVTTILPVGSIVSYMGTTAPENYLICDGTTYNIADYKKLADHIKHDFGSYNYFGGDGETTFAVPDLRGEFLRGAGTNGHTNQGNGANVGVHQDNGLPNITGSFYSYAWDSATGSGAIAKTVGNSNGVDGSISGSEYDIWTFDASKANSIYGNSNYVTPTNTSVNYIIKVK